MNLKRRRFRLIYINKLKNNEINKQNICKIKKKKDISNLKTKYIATNENPNYKLERLCIRKEQEK